MKQHTEGSIIKILRRYFQNGYTYRLDNAFIFSHDWESDFFFINRDGWSFEVEVKVSLSDFRADFKKKKHEIFKTGYYTDRDNKKIEKKFIPNRFYYAVPEGLVDVKDIPEYAGLITVNEYELKIVKRAPFIHRRKIDFRRVLCDKFYNRWIDCIRANNLLLRDYKQLKIKVEKL